MKDSCFLAPIHRPKFEYGIQLIRSYNEHFDDDHIFLVFSSIDEQVEFARISHGLQYQSVVCDQHIGNSPTTQKKFFGLQHIYSTTSFEYVAAIDVDTLFFKNVDYSELFNSYYQRGILYGNDYDFSPRPMIESPFKFFNLYDQGRLHELTNRRTTYFWFNDIPVFKRNYFLDFIKYSNYNNRISELSWFDFDFIVYAYYLLIRDAFKILPIVVDGAKLNNIFIEDQKIIPKDVFEKAFDLTRPMWVNSDVRNDLMTQTFMYVHVDRL